MFFVRECAFILAPTFNLPLELSASILLFLLSAHWYLPFALRLLLTVGFVSRFCSSFDRSGLGGALLCKKIYQIYGHSLHDVIVYIMKVGLYAKMLSQYFSTGVSHETIEEPASVSCEVWGGYTLP